MRRPVRPRQRKVRKERHCTDCRGEMRGGWPQGLPGGMKRTRDYIFYILLSIAAARHGGSMRPIL
jgi:hypothetical protein